MGVFSDFIISEKKYDNDTLHISLGSGNINGNLSLFQYRDKDTRQIICYIPSLELTGYGSDQEKAIKMIKFSLGDYFSFLFTLSAKKLKAELLALKWKHNTFKNKEYSNSYVEMSGKLKNLNAVGNKVDRLTIVAA